ncbi:MAG: threonine/serine dehydratase [Pseudoruegeria sp.]
MNFDMILAANKRLAGKRRRTQLLNSPFLDEIAGRRVFVKPECLQQTGSFKFRGAYNAIAALPDTVRTLGVLAISSGNHAQGIAYAAKLFGIKAVIVMPSDAPTMKIENTRAYGAKVVLYDRATEDRDKIGTDLAARDALTLIKPFDEPLVIAGQGTIGLELAEQAKLRKINEAEVLVPCGGGGLTSGIALALEAKAPGLRVRPVEPEGFDDVTRSLQTGVITRNASTSGSICDAIITPQPGDITFPIMQRLCGEGIVVSESDCLCAMATAFARLKIVVEPGGAAALAAALYQGDSLEGDSVIVVVSGGNVDGAVFQKALTDWG